MRNQNNAGSYQVGADLSTGRLSLAALDSWLDRLLAAHPPRVWLLSGDLGAGKTTLVQHLGRRLGVRGDITSPTFSLQKIHPLRGQQWKILVHLDAYRLKLPSEALALELPEYLADPASLVVVEWPERLPGVVWGPHLLLKITKQAGRNDRSVRVRRG